MATGYRRGPSTASNRGCVAATIITFPLFCFLFLADTLGDCAPDTACKKGLVVGVPAPCAAVSFGVVRAIGRWIGRRDRRN